VPVTRAAPQAAPHYGNVSFPAPLYVPSAAHCSPERYNIR
jgi:hypothetical protein